MTEQRLSPLKQALIALDEMQARVDELERFQYDAIAVIGMACRFPAGGVDPKAFWQALESGVDGVRRIPAERWPATAIDGDKPATRWAGLLESVDQFDAAFFGMSPREAMLLDPQQRMVLEVAWEALEAAGQPADRLLRTKTGVFLGIMRGDYAHIVREADPFDIYSGTGSVYSVVAGRLSHVLGLEGPSMVLDTACSSSLVAVHLACQSLRNQESDMALAGGVNAILDPLSMAMTAEIQALAPDGRCKTFDAQANGFVRGEGCGMVMLKRLSDAERDGDPILAVIRGSVVNQDGRSTGLTAPNVLSQQAMLHRALEITRFAPEDIGYVETHGTGTPLGDPIEFEALREVLGTPRADGSKCVLGALKTNVGHMEGAAGIGGLIKAILCLKHEAIPRNLHFKTLNPRISIEDTPFVIPTETIPWKSNGKPRRAGVSSFGISGTNAHVILEEAPRREEKPFEEASSYILPLSAKTPEALVALAKSYQEWFVSHDEPLHHVAYTASVRRSHLEHRLSVVGSTKAEIASILGAFAAGEMPPGAAAGKASPSAPKVVFVFPGQGSQWVGMGRQLYREEPAFREALGACDEAIRKETGYSIVEELDKPTETSRLSDIDVVQPVLFAIEVALAALWRAWGVEPAAVVGHSMGEVAAAFVAGALSMEDAAAIICRRSRLLRKVAGQGAMALVELTLSDAEKALAGYEGQLSIAVSNGPRSTVIAGDPAALEKVLSKLEQNKVFCRRIKVDVASHSPQMDPLRDELLSALAGISAKSGSIPMRSTVTGEHVRGEELSAAYWADNLRKPVLFSNVIGQWIADGHTIFIEMSPHPILAPSVEENLRGANAEGMALASTRREQDERQAMLSSLGALFTRGVAVAWKAFFPGGERVVQLPTYPWQKERYWLEAGPTAVGLVRKVGHLGASNSLTGGSFVLSTQPEVHLWETEWRSNTIAYFQDHCVNGKIIVPGTAYLEMAASVVSETRQFPIVIEDILFSAPLVLEESISRVVQTVRTEREPGRHSVVISALQRVSEDSASDANWSKHAEMSARIEYGRPRPSSEVIETIQSRCTRHMNADEYYELLGKAGVSFGPTFRGIVELYLGPSEALTYIRLPAEADEVNGHVIHPAFLDAVVQSVGAATGMKIDGGTMLFAMAQQFVLYEGGLREGWCHARLRSSLNESTSEVVGDATLFDAEGRVLASFDAVRFRRLMEAGSQRAKNEKPILELQWELADKLSDPLHQKAGEKWLLIASVEDVLTTKMAALLGSLECDVTRIDVTESFAAFEKKLGETFAKDASFRGAIHLIGATRVDDAIASAQEHSYSTAFAVAQALVAVGMRDAPQFFLVTRGSEFVESTQSNVSCGHATVSGLARALAMSSAKLVIRHVDLAPVPSDDEAQWLVREVAGGRHDEIAFRAGNRYVGHLALEELPPVNNGQSLIRNDASYLIAGEDKEVSAILVDWLMARGAHHFILCGQFVNGETWTSELKEKIEASGGSISITILDWSNASAVSEYWAKAQASAVPIRGVFHIIPTCVDGDIWTESVTSFNAKLEQRLRSASLVHSSTDHLALDMFVSFVPASALLGAPNAPTDVASSAFVEALMRRRRESGRPGSIIVDDVRRAQWDKEQRVGALQSCLDRAMESHAKRLDVMQFDARQWVQQYPHTASLPRLAHLMRRTQSGQNKSRNTALFEALKDATREQGVVLLEEFVKKQVGQVLRMDAARIDRLAPLRELGIDSLMSLEIRNRFERELDLYLSATLVFTFPNAAELAQYLLDRLRPSRTNDIVKVVHAEMSRDAHEEAIAVVGMACHFPAGATDPQRFWDALVQGRDGVTEIPATRWPLDVASSSIIDPIRQAARWGAFLEEDVSQFDAEFFGISPREASRLDPQQRLLLQLSWEALERAGIARDTINKDTTGVFMGFTFNDYAELCAQVKNDQDDFYTILGNGHCFAAGRLSYTFGLQGPSMTVDTACSSSLVAVHLACQSLASRESSLVIVGGTKLMLSPSAMKMSAKTQGMSPDGRCKTFDAQANGFVRGEGCGVVVLKRLSDAERDGDRILAVIRGTAVNQDGRSAGLAAPNVLSQQALLRRALDVARLRPEDIGYVETHGTGTSLGDPIEFDALREVFGAPRADGSRCVLGALKTNIGHMEAAAGIGGLIKAILCLQHEAIPKNLHFTTLNPRMSVDGTPFVIPTEMIPWKSNGKPRHAGVSSFGISGTNAHVILEEAPRHDEKPFQEASGYLLPLSAKTPEALVALAKSYQEWFASHDEPLHHIAYTASLRRSHLEHRLTVVGSTKDEIGSALEAFCARETHPKIVAGKAGQTAPKVVFVFPGQGSQWVGMGRQLYREEPVFRDAFTACDNAIRAEAGYSIIEELDKPIETSRVADIDVVQPVLFAMEVALAALWRSWGVEPAAVIGHSMGEVAAAFVAGALSMGDAAAIICRRSRLLRKVAGQGAMALVELTLSDAEKALAGYEGQLSVAVSNGPRSTVIAGDPAALEKVLGQLEQNKVFCRRIKVDVASHSPQMDPLRDELLSALAGISPKSGSIPMRSTVTGERIRGEELSGAYWTDNLRKPVLFSKVVEQWIADGHTIFVEMSPHPILTPSIEENLCEANAQGLALASTRREKNERQSLLASLGTLFTRGVAIAWKAFFPDGGRIVQLPTYPWQKERYWVESSNRPTLARKSNVALSGDSQLPLVGVSFTSTLNPDARLWRQSMSTATIPWLSEHRVQTEVVFPGAGYVECALEAGRDALGATSLLLEDIAFEQMMVFSDDQVRDVEVVLLDDGARKSFRVSSQSENSAWIRHASGYIGSSDKHSEEKSESPSVIANRLPSVIDVAAYYEGIRALQAYHGPPFQGIVELRAGEHEALAKIQLPEDVHDEGYVMHPALLDACIQVSGALRSASLEDSGTYVPVGIERLHLVQRPGRQVWVIATKSANDETRRDLRVVDDDGEALVTIEGLRLQRIDRVIRSADPFAHCVYEVEWREATPLPEPKRTDRGTWLVFADCTGLGDGLADRFSKLGQRCIRVVPGSSYENVSTQEIRVDPSKPEDYRRCFKEIFGEDGPCEGVVHLSSLDVTPFDQTTTASLSSDLSHACVSATYLTQAIMRHGFRNAPRLFLVTRGAQAVHSTDPVSVAQAPMLGLGKTMAMEHPEVTCTRIDLPAHAGETDGELLLRELGSKDREDQIALRGNSRHVARLIAGKLRDARDTHPPIRADRTYMITGGLGGLGFSLAQWLVEQGARNLVLVSRKGPSEDAQISIRAMEEKGARVYCAAVDVSHASDVERLFTMIREDMAPLGGIVHAAMVLDDHTLLEQSEESFQKVFAPKALGAWNLHQYSQSSELDFFVMYSSGASLTGSPGQGNYCASNAFLDALCRERMRRGLPGMSIQWGGFAEVGAAAALDIRGKRLSYRGGASLVPAEGLEAFRRLIVQPRADVGIMRFDPRQWVEFYPGTAGIPFFAEIMKRNTGRDTSRAKEFLERLRAARPEECLSVLEKHLREQVGVVLHLEPSRIDPLVPLQSLGMDSLMSLEVRNRIEQSLGLRLSATVLFAHACTDALARHLLERLGLQSTTTTTSSKIDETASLENEFVNLSDDELMRAGEDLLS